MRGRPSSARASSRPATSSARRCPNSSRRRARSKRWSASPRPARTGPSSARRRHEVPGGVQGGESRTARWSSSGSTPAPTAPSSRDRVGAYLSAQPGHDRLFRHRPLARLCRAGAGRSRRRARQGADGRLRHRRRRSCEQMEAGYIQVQVDQQPYMQGFMPVMEAYLVQDRRPGAGRHRHRQGHRVKEDVPKLDGTGQAGRSLSATRASGTRRRRPVPARPDIVIRPESSMKRLMKIYLEKPELAAVVFLLLLLVRLPDPLGRRLPERAEPARHARACCRKWGSSRSA